MRYLLHTTLLVDHLAGRPSAVALLRQLFSEPNDLLVCDAIVAEALSQGTDNEVSVLGALIDALDFVATHPDAARWAGASRRRLRQTSSRRLGDAIIAGVAWHQNAIVVTRNPKEFEIQGVRVLAYD